MDHADTLNAKRRAAALRAAADSTAQAYLRRAGEEHGIRIVGARATKGKVEVRSYAWVWIEVKPADEFYCGRTGRSI
jgi:hypothetical protein